MKRRSFLRKISAGTLAVPHVGAAWEYAPTQHQGRSIVPMLLHENDRQLADMLDRQSTDTADRNFGGVPSREGLYHAGSAGRLLRVAASSYIEAASPHHRSSALVEPMQRAADFLLNTQHSDGTIDLLTTNFHSTPDTGFVVEPVAQAYALLLELGEAAMRPVQEKMRRFLLQAGEALSVGGIHTPNHRWVVSMALSRIHALFPDARYVGRIDQWLAEGIDIDEDGQYTERSTHIYSPLTNRCLITIARLLERDVLLEPVRRNLEMTLYYVHPNGEVATEASGRQDQYQIGTLVNYHYPYRYMALRDRNGRFAAATRLVESTLDPAQLSGSLAHFQEEPTLADALPESEPLPDSYRKVFAGSGLARIRRGDRDATVLARNPTLLAFTSGDAVLQAVRVASAFFGKGQFESDQVEWTGDSFELEQDLEGPYYQPYPVDELPEDGDWEKMPRFRRPQSEVQRLHSSVSVREEGDAFVLLFDIRGTEHVPVALELAFRAGGVLSGVDTVAGIDDAYLLSEGEGTYEAGGSRIRFGPGRVAHSWTQLRGALPKLNGMSVYITGYTPFEYELRIR